MQTGVIIRRAAGADLGSGQDGTTPEASADTRTVRSATGVDHIVVSGSGAHTAVSGLAPLVTPVNRQAEDFLLIDTPDGDDTVDSSGLGPGTAQLLVR